MSKPVKSTEISHGIGIGILAVVPLQFTKTISYGTTKKYRKVKREYRRYFLLQVVKSDGINLRGGRTVSEGDIDLSEGFDFNANGKLSGKLPAEMAYGRKKP